MQHWNPKQFTRFYKSHAAVGLPKVINSQFMGMRDPGYYAFMMKNLQLSHCISDRY